MSIDRLLEKMNLDNKKVILILLFGAVIFYLDYSFLMTAQINSANSLRPKITKLSKDIEALNKDLANISSLRNSQAKPVAGVKQLISEEQLSALMEEISNLANKNKVRIMQIKPAKELKSKEETVLNLKLDPQYIQLDISAGYHNLGSFINDLENLDKFIAVQDLKIVRGVTDYLHENVSLLLKTYVKK